MMKHAVEQPTPTPEILSGTEAARRAETLAPLLGPELGVALLDPAAALTLAQLKPHAAIRWMNEHSTGEAFARVQDTAAELQLMLGMERSKKPKVNTLHLLCAPAMQRVTSQTRLPGIPHLDASEGIPAGIMRLSHELQHVAYGQGVLYGYPDTAIMDYEVLNHEADPGNRIYITGIRVAPQSAYWWEQRPDGNNYYDPESVEFIVRAENAEHPEVLAAIRASREILDAYFDDPWVRDYGSQRAVLAQEKKRVERRTHAGIHATMLHW